MNRAVDPCRVVTIVLDGVQLLPSAGIVWVRRLMVWLKPERIPRAREIGKIRANFEVSILLRKIALRGEETRCPTTRVTVLSGIVGLSRDGEHTVLNAERVVARCCIEE